MTPFHTRCPELAARETRGLIIPPGGPLPAGEYGVIEWFCEDPGCDCRRAFLQVIARHQADRILASINFGWESRAFYQRQFPYDPDAPKQITQGSLDPLNPQSHLAEAVLRIFQQVIADRAYADRLKRHYQAFKATLPREKAEG